MKIRNEQKFNRYTFTVLQTRACLCALHESRIRIHHQTAEAKQKLIATTPYSKIAATLSQQRRRHFLIATKTPIPVRQAFATNHESRVTDCGPPATNHQSPITSSRYNLPVPIKLIAMDLDGTLLDSESKVPEENLRAIAEATARGIEIVIVTGRRYHSARLVTDALPCPLHLIVNNGALIKNKAGETHQRSLLPAATARRVLEATPEFRRWASVVFDRPRENQVIMEEVDWDDPFRGGYFRRSREFIAQVKPLTDCLNGQAPQGAPAEDPIQAMFVGLCAPIREALGKLEQLPFADEFTLSFTEYLTRDLSVLDVLGRGVSKGAALADWTRHRGIRREEVMAIGDNWNDRDMLEFAGRPVVMGNSVEGLKSQGWAVTLSNDENGLAEAIRRYALDPAPLRGFPV
jgi:Cof subfamily protein (haloacid dehalogenase superfamily)